MYVGLVVATVPDGLISVGVAGIALMVTDLPVLHEPISVALAALTCHQTDVPFASGDTVGVIEQVPLPVAQPASEAV